MRQLLVLSILVLTGLAPSARADDAKKELDKKVVDVVKQATDLYKNAQALFGIGTRVATLA